MVRALASCASQYLGNIGYWKVAQLNLQFFVSMNRLCHTFCGTSITRACKKFNIFFVSKGKRYLGLPNEIQLIFKFQTNIFYFYILQNYCEKHRIRRSHSIKNRGNCYSIDIQGFLYRYLEPHPLSVSGSLHRYSL